MASNLLDVQRLFPGSGLVPAVLSTGQPVQPFNREPQLANYYAYIHTWLPLAANGFQVQRDNKVDGDADFHIRKITVMATSRAVKYQLQITPLSEFFHQVPLYLAHLGSGQFPFQLPDPIVVPRNGIIASILDEKSTEENTIRIAYHGAKVYRRPKVDARRYIQSKWYGYPANFTADNSGNGPIPAGETRAFTIQVDQDSDFDVKKITIASDSPVLFMVESASDQWFQVPMHSTLVGGNTIGVVAAGTLFSGEVPWLLPAPRLIDGAGYITVTAENLDQDNPNNVQVIFWGTRRYPAGGLR